MRAGEVALREYFRFGIQPMLLVKSVARTALDIMGVGPTRHFMRCRMEVYFVLIQNAAFSRPRRARGFLILIGIVVLIAHGGSLVLFVLPRDGVLPAWQSREHRLFGFQI